MVAVDAAEHAASATGALGRADRRAQRSAIEADWLLESQLDRIASATSYEWNAGGRARRAWSSA